ncbi:hypothetical protein BCV69DRAFT_47795 [Microstroma glucosiphilum]|uniref:Uncharacterized protein n=1 Tax=Pseudomicrostroma glucosiphilum TaxID=1684307 RepID=A0A316U339_9BASI|nr:hypothetical protein BCV69DRAFT_47795 [Pseudomicrostroma glucosiphilum]PWN19214.1 hypothetical protein BCV69DRAFT_47795 [Pseudomicrostroma glucosiphilum]
MATVRSVPHLPSPLFQRRSENRAKPLQLPHRVSGPSDSGGSASSSDRFIPPSTNDRANDHSSTLPSEDAADGAAHDFRPQPCVEPLCIDDLFLKLSIAPPRCEDAAHVSTAPNKERRISPTASASSSTDSLWGTPIDATAIRLGLVSPSGGRTPVVSPHPGPSGDACPSPTERCSTPTISSSRKDPASLSTATPSLLAVETSRAVMLHTAESCLTSASSALENDCRSRQLDSPSREPAQVCSGRRSSM